MPARSGQLDQISEAIGEIRGTVAGIERYIHEERHGVRNLSQKVDGLSTQFSREIAAAKGEIGATLSTALERVEARIQTIDERVSILERTHEREYGARGLLKAIFASPLLAWLFAAAVAVWTWLNTQGVHK
jgi:chromosome segregation ATPase